MLVVVLVLVADAAGVSVEKKGVVVVEPPLGLNVSKPEKGLFWPPLSLFFSESVGGPLFRNEKKFEAETGAGAAAEEVSVLGCSATESVASVDRLNKLVSVGVGFSAEKLVVVVVAVDAVVLAAPNLNEGVSELAVKLPLPNRLGLASVANILLAVK